ncbi:MAG: acyl-CoA dehydrogenase family protein [Syntrophomonadaceae bacterium]|jgi:alkylation response protein AidB-like acyl-CoA dehydrogenase
MQIELSEKQIALKKEVGAFLDRDIAPLVEEYEKQGRIIAKELMKKVLPFGYIGGLLPKEVGGRNLDLISYALMIEELSRVWPSLRIMVAGSNLLLTYIYRYGSEDHKKKYMERLLNGDMIGYFALSEPEAGSDAGSIKMTAELKDGYYVLNGTKTYIACGLDGDLGLVFASTDPSQGAKGITAFLVEKGVSEYKARQVFKMGTNCATMAELTFENTKVPVENRLGNPGEGLRLAMSFLSVVRSIVPFVCAGVGQACIDASIEFAKKRIQFNKPIAKFQLIQERIANMVVQTEAMRLLGYQACYLVDKGVPCQKEVSIAKLFASEAIQKVVQDAMQIHGQYGYVKDYPIERYYRDICYFTMADGTSEMHRLIIGKNVLGISAYV